MESLVQGIRESLRYVEGAPSVQMQRVPADLAAWREEEERRFRDEREELERDEGRRRRREEGRGVRGELWRDSIGV